MAEDWSALLARYHQEMSGIVHISEEDAARDFPALLRSVRASEMVVIECEDGTEALISLKNPEFIPEGRTIAEALGILRAWQQTHEPATIDAEFAADMEAIHALYNQPMHSALSD